MTFWATVAGMLAVTFGSRYAGVALPAALPDFWVRCLHFVPIAVFAALVTPSLEGESVRARSASQPRTSPRSWPGGRGISVWRSHRGCSPSGPSAGLRRDGVRLAEQPAHPLALDRGQVVVVQ